MCFAKLSQEFKVDLEHLSTIWVKYQREKQYKKHVQTSMEIFTELKPEECWFLICLGLETISEGLSDSLSNMSTSEFLKLFNNKKDVLERYPWNDCLGDCNNCSYKIICPRIMK